MHVTYDYKINSMKNLTGDVRYKIVGELKLINPKDNKFGVIPKNNTEYKEDKVKIMKPLVT